MTPKKPNSETRVKSLTDQELDSVQGGTTPAFPKPGDPPPLPVPIGGPKGTPPIGPPTTEPIPKPGDLPKPR